MKKLLLVKISLCLALILGFSSPALATSGLRIANGTGSVEQAIIAADDFEITFDRNYGGKIADAYDLANDPGKADDWIVVKYWAGGLFSSYGRDQLNVVWTLSSATGATLEIMEISEARVVIKSTCISRQPPPASGDSSEMSDEVWYYIYPTGKIGIRNINTYDNFDMQYIEPGIIERNPVNLYNASETQVNSQAVTDIPAAAGDNFVLNDINDAGNSHYFDTLLVQYQDWGLASSLYRWWNNPGNAQIGWRYSAVQVYTNTISRDFLLQLGTLNGSYLPDMNNNGAPASDYAADYRSPATLSFNSGSGVGDGFAEQKAAYTMAADANEELDVDIDVGVLTRYKPAFEIDGLNHDAGNYTFYKDDVLLNHGTDYVFGKADSDTGVLQLLSDEDANFNLRIVYTPDETGGNGQLPITGADQNNSMIYLVLVLGGVLLARKLVVNKIV